MFNIDIKIVLINIMSYKFKIIDISNFHSQVENFCSEYSIDICDDKILIKMAKNGYYVSSISPMKVKRALAECRIRATNGKHEESISIINSCLIPCPHCQKKEKEEEEEEEEYKIDSDSESE